MKLSMFGCPKNTTKQRNGARAARAVSFSVSLRKWAIMSQRECDFRGGRHSFFAFLVYFGHRGDEKDFVCFDHGDTVTFDPTKSKTPATKKWTSDFTTLRFRNSISPLPLCRDPCMSSPFSCLCARARARARGRASEECVGPKLEKQSSTFITNRCRI